MSKSAIKSLNRANEILAVLGLVVKVDMISDADIRKDWRNADVLACLIINSAANALQSESADTLDENMFDDMQDAIDCYIQANLESWNQKEWAARDVKAELARLAEMVNGQLAYNAREKDHAEALEMNREFIRDNFEEKYTAAMQYNEFDESDVAEALELNKMVDEAVFLSTLYAGNAYLDHVSLQHAVDSIRSQLLNMNRYPARFIVKMMVSVRRLAKEARQRANAEYIKKLSRPAVTGIDHELPF